MDKETISFADLSVVIPVFNEEENMGGLLDRVRSTVGAEAEIIVVDDASTDRTREIVGSKDVRLICHPYNKGNGAAVKTGLRAASRPIVVMMDGDGQHRPEDIPALMEKLVDYDMAIGARTSKSAQSAHRGLYNRMLNVFAGYLTGRKIPDLTSGFRAMRREVASKFIYLLPNTFSYPSTITLSMIKAGHNVCFVPLAFDARRGSSKIHLIKDGIRFLMIILRISTLFAPIKVFLPVSILFFGGGIGWYIFTYIKWHRFTNWAMFMLSTGVIVFMLGLIAEQISQMRFDRTEE